MIRFMQKSLACPCPISRTKVGGEAGSRLYSLLDGAQGSLARRLETETSGQEVCEEGPLE
jgi:hypothetical protein